MNSRYLNKVNAITVSRIILTILGVLLIFSGNIKLLIAAYIIMSLSEVSDIIDGYVARRDKLVTDLGKILDPLSDSISRFFYFFALAYHGLFPIWFMVFFFFRDIVVAYVRIFASFSGTVMGARFSGKLKGGVQFAGQYLLMYALLINTVRDGSAVTGKFITGSIITGVAINVITLIVFKIKGKLLSLILVLMAVLASMLYFLPYVPFKINYLTTFLISFGVISVTLYSLADYLFSLGNPQRRIFTYLCSACLIIMMFVISPYFLDLVKNKFESGAAAAEWDSYDILSFEKNDNIKVTGITADRGRIIISASKKKAISRLYIYGALNSEREPEFVCDLPSHITDVKDIELIGGKIYLTDDSINKVIEIDKDSLLDSGKVKILSEFDTGLSSSSTIGAVKFNSVEYLLINDYVFSGYLYFCPVEGLDTARDLISQSSFRIRSELYIKNIHSSESTIYMIADKLGKDLVYCADVDRAIFSGSIQNAVSRILIAPDRDLKGISMINGRIVTYGNRSKRIFVEEK